MQKELDMITKLAIAKLRDLADKLENQEVKLQGVEELPELEYQIGEARIVTPPTLAVKYENKKETK